MDYEEAMKLQMQKAMIAAQMAAQPDSRVQQTQPREGNMLGAYEAQLGNLHDAISALANKVDLLTGQEPPLPPLPATADPYTGPFARHLESIYEAAQSIRHLTNRLAQF